jgi:hypothetical protein
MKRRGFSLDTAGCSMLVWFYRDNGMWNMVTHLIVEMQELDVRMPNGLIDTCGKYGQLVYARAGCSTKCG